MSARVVRYRVAMGSGQDKIYGALRQRIVAGQYGPGTQLREEPLAQEFGLSRTPVRAALKRLVEDGLATADAGQGIHVATWTEHDIAEVLKLRLLLEPHAASLACQRGGAALVECLTDCNERMSRALERDHDDAVADLRSANRDFHLALVDAAGSPRLRTLLTTLIDMPIITRSYALANADERRLSLNHHIELTQAAEMADGDLADRIMQVHLRTAFARFSRRRAEQSSATTK
jgi:DNA-binding GntR family transcriptional regulator